MLLNIGGFFGKGKDAHGPHLVLVGLFIFSYLIIGCIGDVALPRKPNETLVSKKYLFLLTPK